MEMISKEEVEALRQAAQNVLDGKSDVMSRDYMGDILRVIAAYSKAFPDGELNVDDQGATQIMLTTEAGVVKVLFDKPTAWVGMGPDQAADFGLRMIQYARQLGLTKPVTIQI